MDTQIHKAMSKVAQMIALMKRTFELNHLTEEAKLERLQSDSQELQNAYENLEQIFREHFELSETFEVEVPGY